MKVAVGSSFDQLVHLLEEQHTQLCATSAAMLETIGTLDEAGDWGDDETSLSCFLAARCGLRSATAVELVRVARKLRSLPAIRSAHATGRLSYDQLRPLTRFATEETDERLAADAPSMSVPQLYREAARHERARRERLESDHQMRYLDMRWDDERRFLHLEGLLPAEQGAAVENALGQRAKDIVIEDAEVFDRRGARMADALTELATSSSGASAPATLVVHADANVLTRQAEPGPQHLGRDRVRRPTIRRSCA